MENDKLVRLSDVLDLSYTHDTHDGWGVEAVDKESIMSIPAVDAVEVVRCADCKHWYGPDDGYTHSCDVDAWVRPGWWFCPAGKRREDGDV